MTRLSQKDLLNEGIGSMMKAVAKVGLKGAVAGAKELGKAIAPETAKALSKIGTAASGAFVEIMGASAKIAIKSWLSKPEGRRLFKNVDLGKEKTLQNKDVEVDFAGQFMDPTAPNVAQDKKGKFIVRPIEEGRWRIIKAVDLNGEDIWSGEYKPGDDKKDKPDKPDKPEVPLGPDPGRPEVPEGPTGPQPPGPPVPPLGPDPGRPEAPPEAPAATKPKFFDALRQWKVKTIGPDAATVGISGAQLKEFLISLNVPDPDRVIKGAGVDNYGKSVSNKILDTIKATLQSRDLVSENILSQKSILRRLQLL